jgi:hypothetical protein
MSTAAASAVKQHGQVVVQGAYRIVSCHMLPHDSGRLPVNALFRKSLQAHLTRFSPVKTKA